MKSLAILGASGHAKVVADAALCAGWENVFFFDDKWPTLSQVSNWTVHGNIDSFLTDADTFDEAIVAIGNNAIRLDIINLLLKRNIPIATIIHPSAVVSKYSIIAPGTVIFAKAVLNPDCVIGLGSIINTGSIIEHDNHLGQAVHISPGASLAGNVQIGDLSWVGIGSSIRQNINIGKNVIIGAGAAVVQDLPDNCTAVGVPAKIKQ